MFCACMQLLSKIIFAFMFVGPSFRMKSSSPVIILGVNVTKIFFVDDKRVQISVVRDVMRANCPSWRLNSHSRETSLTDSSVMRAHAHQLRMRAA